MSELKSCPFCGGEAFVRQLYQHPIVDAKHYEFCPLAYRPLPYDPPTVTRSAAIAAWNRRAEPTATRISVPREGHTAIGHYECGDCRGVVGAQDAHCKHCGARLVEP